MLKPSGADAGIWRRTFGLLVILVLLAPFATPTPVVATPPRAQPALLALVAERPTASVSVIVQKSAPDAAIEAAVARLGGVVTGDLAIIHAVAARLPAGAVPALAQTVGVRWVSLDGPVEDSGK